MHVIPKVAVLRYSNERKRSAVRSLLDMARMKIRELRKDTGDDLSSRKLAFWTQQLANADLYLVDNG